ncbi:MAG: protein kinase [Deltaproteobacteria bacterium]|nr:protein kinase [Deltaproteobacteria bacterium]
MRPLAPIAPPKILGRYEVGAKIGGGGMATVYIGFAPREDGTEEHVALKVIRDELAHDEEFARMFVDEAKILARLSHPNVIHTLEYGVTGHHRFIAMELLSGRTYYEAWELLASRNESMPLELAAWICARTAEGLHSAHELVDETGAPLGVIHRDVNPGNVFLTFHGDVKLIDFGLAKARVRLSKSAEGIVKGKIPYLAPEQASGKAIDRRIDLYALGTTLWESVTMKRLFKRATDVDTLRAIREAKVPDVREMIEGFPAPLWAIIERALKVDPDERYADADEIRRDLDAFAGDAEARKRELVALLERLYPGQEAKQASWERAATAPRQRLLTMPPPHAVPMASSTLLEDPPSEPEISKPPPPPPKPTIETLDDSALEDAPPSIRKPETRADAGGEPPVKKSKKGKKRRDKERSKARASSIPPPRRTPRSESDDERRRKKSSRVHDDEPAPPPPTEGKKSSLGILLAAIAAVGFAVWYFWSKK